MNRSEYDQAVDEYMRMAEGWNGELSRNFKQILREFGWFILQIDTEHPRRKVESKVVKPLKSFR